MISDEFSVLSKCKTYNSLLNTHNSKMYHNRTPIVRLRTTGVWLIKLSS